MINSRNLIYTNILDLTSSSVKFIEFSSSGYLFGRLQQLIEFFGQVTKEDLEWRFPPQTFPGTPI